MAVETMTESKPYKTDEEWRASLNRQQYAVCRCSATEPPGSGKWWYRHKEAGTYVCVACHAPLFASQAKYDSGSGWPSFFQPVKHTSLSLVADESHGMRRTEVRCAVCDSHLGHVFPDGPEPTGLRYCINSVALDFIPDRHALSP